MGLRSARFAQWFPGHGATWPTAAVALILAGVSLWLLKPGALGARLLAARGGAAAVTVLGLLTTVEVVLGKDLGIERLLFATQASAAQLAPEGRRYLDRVAAGARQKGQLIDDLLAFSRLGRTPSRCATWRQLTSWGERSSSFARYWRVARSS